MDVLFNDMVYKEYGCDIFHPNFWDEFVYNLDPFRYDNWYDSSNDHLDDLADSYAELGELEALRGLPEPTDNNVTIADKGWQPSRCFKWHGGMIWI